MPKSRSPEARPQPQKPVIWARARCRTVSVNRKTIFVLEALLDPSAGDPGGPSSNYASAEADGGRVVGQIG